MAILDMLSKQLSPDVVQGIGQQVGLNSDETGQALSALLPMMLGGLAKNAQGNPQNAMALSTALERDHDGSILDHVSNLLGTNASGSALGSLMNSGGSAAAMNMVSGMLGNRGGSSGANTAASVLGGLLGGGNSGNSGAGLLGAILGSAPTSQRGINATGILGHILGAQQNPIQDGIAKALGLDPKKVGLLMTFVAPMVMGALGKAKRQQNLSANGLTELLNRERQTIEQQVPETASGGGLLGLLGGGTNNQALLNAGLALGKSMLLNKMRS